MTKPLWRIPFTGGYWNEVWAGRLLLLVMTPLYLAAAILAVLVVVSFVAPAAGGVGVFALTLAATPAAVRATAARLEPEKYAQPSSVFRAFWLCVGWAAAVAGVVGLVCAFGGAISYILPWLFLVALASVPPLTLLYIAARRSSGHAKM
ncbi:hypothetical protein [Salinibacterium sp. ZJ454]|uniref:hypothetical protein n=1 Tax=Salinibacterium sp. ZJ454 TaxID=2708339 RepID=UPI00141E0502|nr:hypothetical protein [Salinibacterium sp. ZJ454]